MTRNIWLGVEFEGCFEREDRGIGVEVAVEVRQSHWSPGGGILVPDQLVVQGKVNGRVRHEERLVHGVVL